MKPSFRRLQDILLQNPRVSLRFLVVMLFLLIAATAAPERGLLFASTGGKPNGCAGHGPPESSKCGQGKEDWVCKPTPKPQAPDCRECSDPSAEGNNSGTPGVWYSYSMHDCPNGARLVTYPPECCHFGGAFVVEELHTAVTALLGTPGFESFCSTPGVCKEWANGTGFGTSSNGFAYGIKYTEIGGPNDGQEGCLVNREVLNDEVWSSPPVRPPLPPPAPPNHLCGGHTPTTPQAVASARVPPFVPTRFHCRVACHGSACSQTPRASWAC